MSGNFSLKHGDLAQTVGIICAPFNRRLGQLGTRWGHTTLRGTFLVLVSGFPECFQPVPFQGWCNNRSPCESDVKASLPFHGALLWPFHRVKPKGNPCPWPLWCFSPFWHSKKKKSGIGNEKGTAVCTQDTWPLNSNLYSVSGGRGRCGIW